MKKLSFLSIAILAFSISAFSQVEDVAKEVLTAYKNKDVELLKNNASGMMKMSISASYFETKSLQEDLKSAASWDGGIKEIRYQAGEMMGKKMITATAYFADVPATGEICVVLLSSLDNQKWVIVGAGLGKATKEEFEQLSKTIPSEGAKNEEKTVKKFSADMENGETFDKITEEKMVECLNKLDKDNFFLTLVNGEDFLQAAYSDKGFVVEYKEKGIQYAAKSVLPKEETIKLFKNYYHSRTEWNQGIIWEKQ